MENKTTINDILNDIIKEGTEITINIKIHDIDKACELLETMYGANIKRFGVEVFSWGMWDIQKAQRMRNQAILEAMNKPDLEYLKESSNEYYLQNNRPPC